MIDSQQLEQLLKTAKLNSMSDVIQFIFDQLYKAINFQPIQQLSLRIAELEKSQGLDNIMIQEVKTLIQAMLEQKQEQIRRDLERTVHSNVSMALEQENTRRSLRQIDLLQLMASQNGNNKRTSLSCDQKPSNNVVVSQQQQQTQAQIDSIKKQLSEIRLSTQRKLDKRQYTDFKIQIQKEISSKMNVHETEKIVQKFQRDIFNKISQSNTFVQRMEYQLKKSLLNQASSIKKQLLENTKMTELKQKLSKTEKKIKKIDSQLTCRVQQSLASIQKSKKQSKQSIEQLCNLIENIEHKLKGNSQTVTKLEQQLQFISAKKQNVFESGSWLAENKSHIKNNCISWQRQYLNENEQLYKFEPNKTQIVITESGYYNIECYVFGCQKSPELTINGQGCYKLGATNSNKGLAFKLQETAKLGENSKLGIKLESSSNGYTNALIKFTKIG